MGRRYMGGDGDRKDGRLMPETKIIIELTRSKPISGSGSALPDAAHDAYYLAKAIPGIQHEGKPMGDKWSVTAIRCEQPLEPGE